MDENFISILVEQIEKDCPPFLRPSDLIRLNLFSSRASVCIAVQRNQAPPHMMTSPKKMVFPRSGLCAWLRKKAAHQQASS